MASSMQIDGLVSGLKTADLISSMMTVERQPLVALQTQQTTLQAHSTAIQGVATKVSGLKTAIDALARLSTFNPRSVTTDTPPTQQAAVVATANADSAVGSFKLTVGKLATPTKVAGAAAIGKTIPTQASLEKAGFGTTPTDGFFTINGVRITVDADTTTLGPKGTPDGTSVVEMINAAGVGVTASVENNKLVLGSASAIKLGSGADTSNFLAAAKVLAAPDAGTGTVGGVSFAHTVGSTGSIGVTLANASLSDARFQTSLTAASGSFKINGVEIQYDAANDSLSRVINRINASAAGVTATYDSQTDKLNLTAKATGSMAISLEDVGTGNFIVATGLNGAQTAGSNAEYKIDSINGGQTLYSASNTISGVVPGVTLNLKAETTSPVTVTVSQENSSITTAVKSFIDQYNGTISYIKDQTAWDADNKTGGPLLASSEVTGIESRLRQLITGSVTGAVGKYTSLSSIGVSFGAVGSAVGATSTLVLDESKLNAALADNPAAVSRLFVPPDPTVSLQNAETSSLASVTRSTTMTPRAGKYVITAGADGSLSSVFTPTIGVAQSAVTGTITAGGTNSTLITGLVLTGRSTLVGGTDTVLVTPGDSVAGRISSYLDSLVSSTGSLTSSSKSDMDEVSDLGKKITLKESQLTDKEAQLQARFTALEVTMAKLQSQSSSAVAAMASLTNSNSSSS